MAQVIENNEISINNGRGVLENTVFVAEPGLHNVRYMLRTAAIDYEFLQFIDPVKYSDQVFEVNFRWCQPGEYSYENICQECQFTTYSNIWNATQCNQCPERATWQGREINVDKGYWRKDLLTTDIIQCPNKEACLGGYSELNPHPVECAEGYTGILWNEWITEGETKYEQISENMCSQCPDPVLNLMRIIGVALLVLIFMMVLIA